MNIKCKVTIQVPGAMPGSLKNEFCSAIIPSEMVQFIRSATKIEGGDTSKAVIGAGGQVFLTDLNYEELEAKFENTHFGMRND